MGSKFITEIFTEKINYVAIKLIEKRTNAKEVSSTKNIIGGLFKGIIKHKDADDTEHTFILTEQKNEKNKDVISGVNLEYYNILALKIISDENKVWAFATKSDKDQDRMCSIATECLETLRKNKMVVINDENLIDTKLFSGVPSDITHIKKAKTIGQSYSNSPSYSNSNSNIYRPTPKKGPESTFFEFKSPVIEDIGFMRLKLDLVLTGNFKPELPEEIEGKEEPKSAARNNYYGNMGCAFGYG